MDKVLNYLSLARKAGCLETGEEDTGAAVRNGKCKVLLLASDASENARARARGFLHGKNVPAIKLPYTKEQLSTATGKNGCSMAAITDVGFASSFAQALDETFAGRYADTAAELARRNVKARQRKLEAQAHDRNIKTGKRRTKQ